MIKKNNKGFTLAEVLLTLAVVGVVAALVIPPVQRHFEKQAMISGYKETYNIIAQATKMVQADNNADNLPVFLADYNSTTTADFTRFFQAYKPYLNIIKDCGATYASNSHDPCFADSYYKDLRGLTDDEPGYTGYSITLINGASLRFFNNGSGSLQITFDTNGQKGPNTYGKDLHSIQYENSANYKNFKPSGWDQNETNLNSECPPALNSGGGYYCGVRIMRGDYGTAY